VTVANGVSAALYPSGRSRDSRSCAGADPLDMTTYKSKEDHCADAMMDRSLRSVWHSNLVRASFGVPSSLVLAAHQGEGASRRLRPRKADRGWVTRIVAAPPGAYACGDDR